MKFSADLSPSHQVCKEEGEVNEKVAGKGNPVCVWCSGGWLVFHAQARSAVHAAYEVTRCSCSMGVGTYRGEDILVDLPRCT